MDVAPAETAIDVMTARRVKRRSSERISGEMRAADDGNVFRHGVYQIDRDASNANTAPRHTLDDDLLALEVVPKPSDGQRVPLVRRVEFHHNRVLRRLLDHV